MTIDMVEGAFGFISGEIAKTGEDAMTIKTPVATIELEEPQFASESCGRRKRKLIYFTSGCRWGSRANIY